ncbi:hypothetical protein [Photobacterium kishitanii]|uniref:Capsular biosynthesis protein n=1 Tax=Photobacterium kishitanii TaxID=318456 RepID=A0A2T3KC36_9GAMM|nr:hypothetical protein [Photobacterium kishitanii]PSU92855.1 hypothetical protein C9J27_22045 [Photobacterium kishitanii]
MYLFKAKKVQLLLVGCICATSSFAANADSTFQDSKHIDPFLGLEFSSSVSSGYGFDDNVLHQRNSHIISSDYYTLKPTFSVFGQRNTKNFGLYYLGNYRHYNNNVVKSDSYDDHQLNGVFNWELGIRHHLELTGSYSKNHEALGTGVTQGFFFDSDTSLKNIATFNAFNISHDIGRTDKKVDAKYTYGAKGAKGNIIVDLSQARTNYDILNSYQSAFKNYLENENVTENDARIVFRHQYTDRTRFDYTLMYKDFNYINSERDNNELIGAFSVFSQVTGKSKLEATVSKVQKKMQSTHFSGVNWDVSYKWQPVDYSTIILKTSSEAKESDNTGDFVQSFQNGITWKHQFLGHITSLLSYKHTSNKYHIRKRTDRYDDLALSLHYLFRPKIEFVFDYQYTLFHTDNSTDPVFIDGNSYGRQLGYEQNQFGLSVKVAI